MPCQKCTAYISDTLQNPPPVTSPHVKQFKRKRLAVCLETISYLLTRYIEKARPDLFEWLNVMEMMNCASLNQGATRDYRMYQILCLDMSDLQYILTLIMEQCILAKCRDKHLYEEWLAQKIIGIVSIIRQVHIEHSEHELKAILKITVPDDYNGLYD
jgi:hypothetical protein